MNEYNNAPREIGWDDELTNDGQEYILLEEGDYNFTVKDFQRGRFPGSKEGGKIPPCNKAILTLEVETEKGTATAKEDLILWSTLEWKLSEFFRCIGQKKHGEPLRPRWNEVYGSRGRAHFKTEEFKRKDGTKGSKNVVTKFLDYDPAAMRGSVPQNGRQVAAPTNNTNGAPKWEGGKF